MHSRGDFLPILVVQDRDTYHWETVAIFWDAIRLVRVSLPSPQDIATGQQDRSWEGEAAAARSAAAQTVGRQSLPTYRTCKNSCAEIACGQGDTIAIESEKATKAENVNS